MLQFHHKKVKKFDLAGTIHDESAIQRLRNEYVSFIISGMRDSGYVQRLDINHDFTLEYNEAKEQFNFIISVYGIYVGKSNSKWISGIDEYRPIYIQKSKLKEQSLA